MRQVRPWHSQGHILPVMQSPDERRACIISFNTRNNAIYSSNEETEAELQSDPHPAPITYSRLNNTCGNG